MFLVTVAGVATAQSASCLDVADESHHQLLFQNQDVRVFVLELPRLAATQSHCHYRPYLDIVATDGKSSDTLEGRAGVSRDWDGPEAHFIYSPTQHVVRNESMMTYRELIVETMHPANYQPSDGNYDTDLFPADLGTVKPSWTVSFTRGALTASKSQLAPGAEISVSSTAHVPIGPDRPRAQHRRVGQLCSKLASGRARRPRSARRRFLPLDQHWEESREIHPCRILTTRLGRKSMPIAAVL